MVTAYVLSQCTWEPLWPPSKLLDAESACNWCTHLWLSRQHRHWPGCLGPAAHVCTCLGTYKGGGWFHGLLTCPWTVNAPEKFFNLLQRYQTGPHVVGSSARADPGLCCLGQPSHTDLVLLLLAGVTPKGSCVALQASPAVSMLCHGRLRIKIKPVVTVWVLSQYAWGPHCPSTLRDDQLELIAVRWC